MRTTIETLDGQGGASRFLGGTIGPLDGLSIRPLEGAYISTLPNL